MFPFLSINRIYQKLLINTTGILSTNWFILSLPKCSPLVDLFRNQEIEINIDLNELKNLFEALNNTKLKPAIITA